MHHVNQSLPPFLGEKAASVRMKSNTCQHWTTHTSHNIDCNIHDIHIINIESISLHLKTLKIILYENKKKIKI